MTIKYVYTDAFPDHYYQREGSIASNSELCAQGVSVANINISWYWDVCGIK